MKKPFLIFLLAILPVVVSGCGDEDAPSSHPGPVVTKSEPDAKPSSESGSIRGTASPVPPLPKPEPKPDPSPKPDPKPEPKPVVNRWDLIPDPVPHSLPDANTTLKEHSDKAGALGPLNEDEAEAGTGGTPEYSMTYCRQLFEHMHRSGHTWLPQYMKPIFLHGLFNYYFRLYTGGFNPLLPRESINALRTSWARLRVPFPPAKHHEILHWFEYASIELKKNPALQALGMSFQIQKVRLEQFERLGWARNPTGKIYEENGHNNSQQVLIARWIQNVSTELVRRMTDHLAKGTELSPEKDDYIQGLPTLRPALLDEPYWASTLSVLDTYNFHQQLPPKKVQDAYDQHERDGLQITIIPGSY